MQYELQIHYIVLLQEHFKCRFAANIIKQKKFENSDTTSVIYTKNCTCLVNLPSVLISKQDSAVLLRNCNLRRTVQVYFILYCMNQSFWTV